MFHIFWRSCSINWTWIYGCKSWVEPELIWINPQKVWKSDSVTCLQRPRQKRRGSGLFTETNIAILAMENGSFRIGTLSHLHQTKWRNFLAFLVYQRLTITYIPHIRIYICKYISHEFPMKSSRRATHNGLGRRPRCVRNGPGVSWMNSLSKATRRPTRQTQRLLGNGVGNKGG